MPPLLVVNRMRGVGNNSVPWTGESPAHWTLMRMSQLAIPVKCKNTGMIETNLLSLSYGQIVRKDIERAEGLAPASYEEYNIISEGDIVLRLTDLQNDQRSLRTGLAATYLHYLLHAVDVAKVFYSMGAGLRQSLDWGEVSHMLLPVPPSEEQSRIVGYLDKRCGAIDESKKIIEDEIESLRRLRKATIFKAVTKGLNDNVLMRASGIEWVGKIPDGWQIGRIGGLYRHRNEKVNDFDYQPLSVTKKGILPQLKTAAKTNDHDNRKLVNAGDFVINSRSDRRGSCGISGYRGSVSLINTVLEPRELMSSTYYEYLFHTSEFADEFYKCGHGIVDDLWTTRWQDMKSMKVPYPPLDTQEVIADYLDKRCAAIDSIIDARTKQLERLEDYRKALIYAYVTGKKEVPAS